MIELNDIEAQNYALHIQELVKQLQKTSKKALSENEKYLVSDDVAKELFGGRSGETFYLFPNDAPSQEIIDAYERVKPYFGTGENAVSFEQHLSHRRMTIKFVGNDLVIRKDRDFLFIHKLTEENLRNEIECAKNVYQIDWDKARIFIFPFGSYSFYISDSFEEQLSGRSDHRNESNWFSIPLTESINYRKIKELCRKFERGEDIDDVLVYQDNYCNQHKSAENLCKGSVLNIPKSFVGIDFETLYPQRVSACSVGMVKYKHGQIVDRYYTLIRPPFDYPNKSGKVLTWIHGIKKDDVWNERTFAEILPELEEFVEGLPLVAHNACVERGCIKDTTSFYNLDTTLDFENIIDTYTISLTIEKAMGIEIKGEGTHSLDAVCRRFGVPEMRHHNALDDAEMCGNLLLAFENFLSDKNFELQEAAKTPAKKKEKYNAEDKVQRTDLENIAENPFKGCAVVLTGFAVTLSQEYGHKLKELGAKVCTGVSRKTKWLICGPNAGPSKKEKAQDVGAQIISEEAFLSLIQNIE